MSNSGSYFKLLSSRDMEIILDALKLKRIQLTDIAAMMTDKQFDERSKEIRDIEKLVKNQRNLVEAAEPKPYKDDLPY